MNTRTKKLPEYKGYTIDFKLNQFRKVNGENLKIEFIDFNSEEGEKLLNEYIEQLNSNSKEFKELIENIKF